MSSASVPPLVSALIAAFLFAATALTSPVLAADLYWMGNSSSDWFTASNWSPGPALPTDNDIAFISGSTQTVIGLNGTGAKALEVYLGTNNGPGSLLVNNGGTLSSATGVIGYNFLTGNMAVVTGSGSRWSITDGFAVGKNGDGTLTVSDGGSIGAPSIHVASSTGVTGTVNVGGQSGAAAAAPGILDTHNIFFGNGTGTLIFSHTSDNYPFAPEISGPGSIRAENGRTVLTGSNSYTGGTEFHGGTLQISSDTNLGAPLGGLRFTGGTLATTASFDSTRSVSLTQPGRINVASGMELGLQGVVSGSGDLVKQGDGTLRLDHGANTYGDTRVEAGTLIGNAGSISGNISNAGTVAFIQATDASFAGNITGLNGTLGTMIKQGAGALTLTGTSSLNWSLADGELTSSAERFGGNAAISTSAVLVFDQITDAVYAGTFSGNGRFVKSGGGVLTLTGSNTHMGGTTITSGTLQLGDGGTTGSIIGNVVNNGILAFNRSDTVTFAGAISGSGAVQQIGADTTVLTGSNSYIGDTKVFSGTLQFGNGASGGSNTLGGRLDVSGGTLAIQTPATVSITQGVSFADNTALSIVATPGVPSLQANSITLGNGVTFNLGGINSPGQLDKVLIDTTAGITGNFGTVTVGGFSGLVDYLALSTRKSADNLQYLATYNLSWMGQQQSGPWHLYPD